MVVVSRQRAACLISSALGNNLSSVNVVQVDDPKQLQA